MGDYNLTLFEACEILNRSKKSLSRYIRKGLLHPKEVKSKQGTLEYRFSESDILEFREREKARQDRQDTGDETRQDTPSTPLPQENTESVATETKTEETRQDTPDRTDETRQDNIIVSLLKETTHFLKEQLQKKDEQIKDLGSKIDQLIERDREKNVLLKGLQDRLIMLEAPKTTEAVPQEAMTDTPDRTGETDKTEETGQANETKE